MGGLDEQSEGVAAIGAARRRARGPRARRAAGVTAAWSVHVFTASGAVIGMLALLAIGAGELARAGLLMLIALAIDSVDGTLARRARVAERVPRVDGRRLDDIVDYLNFVVVPAVFMVGAGLLPSWLWAAAPVLASAYGFSQENAKTADHFFLGFPSYWNIVAIYLWLFQTSPAAGAAIVVGLAAMVFVPIKYLYPSRAPVFRRTTNLMGMAWALLLTALVAFPEASWSQAGLWLSLAYPAWYLMLSFWLGRRSGRS